jgi:predicted NAD-dependent protein-ADP-ribosyltransferase YbiA (DUF1768 family)
MEENAEVELDGKRFLWDGETWVDPRTYMVPPDAVIEKLNRTFRKDEIRSDVAASRPRTARAPSASTSRRGSGGRFVPSSVAALAKAAPAPTQPVERLTRFEGEHEYLRNEYPANVYYEGQAYPSVAAAYEEARMQHGRLRLGMQREWDEERRVPLMKRLLRSKFAAPELRAKLVASGEKHLSHQGEGGDPFWDAPGGEGENSLGRLLMELRGEMARHYCLLSDETIVDHLREYRPDQPLVPDEALARECCWNRVRELADLYRDELPAGVRAALERRRDEVTGGAREEAASGA